MKFKTKCVATRVASDEELFPSSRQLHQATQLLVSAIAAEVCAAA
jgi:hypothetical protein